VNWQFPWSRTTPEPGPPGDWYWNGCGWHSRAEIAADVAAAERLERKLAAEREARESDTSGFTPGGPQHGAANLP
jgi:hypothetical protein